MKYQMCLKHAYRAAIKTAFIALASLALHTPSQSASVEYRLTNVSGSVWRYDYTVTSASDDSPFDEITIYFDASSSANLIVKSSPADWDSIIIQPDAELPSDGFFDTIFSLGTIPAEQKFSGFSVEFTRIDSELPRSQRFELIDSSTFSIVGTGVTAMAPVPEPTVVSLLLVGLMVMRAKLRVRQ